MKRNDDGTVEFEYADKEESKFIRQYRLTKNGLQWWDWDPATFDDEEVGFLWARCGSMEWDALCSHTEGRALLAEAITALDGCRLCGNPPNTPYGVCESHLINAGPQ